MKIFFGKLIMLKFFALAADEKTGKPTGVLFNDPSYPDEELVFISKAVLMLTGLYTPTQIGLCELTKARQAIKCALNL